MVEVTFTKVEFHPSVVLLQTQTFFGESLGKELRRDLRTFSLEIMSVEEECKIIILKNPLFV